MSAKEVPHFRDFTCKANKKEKYISFTADGRAQDDKFNDSQKIVPKLF